MKKDLKNLLFILVTFLSFPSTISAAPPSSSSVKFKLEDQFNKGHSKTLTLPRIPHQCVLLRGDLYVQYNGQRYIGKVKKESTTEEIIEIGGDPYHLVAYQDSIYVSQNGPQAESKFSIVDSYNSQTSHILLPGKFESSIFAATKDILLIGAKKEGNVTHTSIFQWKGGTLYPLLDLTAFPFDMTIFQDKLYTLLEGDRAEKIKQNYLHYYMITQPENDKPVKLSSAQQFEPKTSGSCIISSKYSLYIPEGNGDLFIREINEEHKIGEPIKISSIGNTNAPSHIFDFILKKGCFISNRGQSSSSIINPKIMKLFKYSKNEEMDFCYMLADLVGDDVPMKINLGKLIKNPSDFSDLRIQLKSLR